MNTLHIHWLIIAKSTQMLKICPKVPVKKLKVANLSKSGGCLEAALRSCS